MAEVELSLSTVDGHIRLRIESYDEGGGWSQVVVLDEEIDRLLAERRRLFPYWPLLAMGKVDA